MCVCERMEEIKAFAECSMFIAFVLRQVENGYCLVPVGSTPCYSFKWSRIHFSIFMHAFFVSSSHCVCSTIIAVTASAPFLPASGVIGAIYANIACTQHLLRVAVLCARARLCQILDF